MHLKIRFTPQKLLPFALLLVMTGVVLLLERCRQQSAKSYQLDPNIPLPLELDSVTYSVGKVVAFPSPAGDASVLLDRSSKFGLVVQLSDVRGGEFFEASVLRQKHLPLITLVGDGRWANHFIQSGWAQDTEGGWERLEICLEVPAHINRTSIRFYCHNPTNTPCHIAQLRIKRFAACPVDTLPDYCFYPMLYELLDNYHLHHLSPIPWDTIPAYADDSTVLPLFLQAGVLPSRFVQTYRKNMQTSGLASMRKPLHRMRAQLRYPSASFVNDKMTPATTPAGYIRDMFCTPDDTAHFVLQHPESCVKLSLYQLHLPHHKVLKRGIPMPGDSLLHLPCHGISPGIYTLTLSGGDTSFEIPLIIRPAKPNKVAILAPLTTWHAYNQWGGKSFYKNGVDSQGVDFVSTLRPLTSVSSAKGHFSENNLFSLLHVYRWFDARYGADLLPDSWLEAHPEELKQYETVVLFGHCEYFSPRMYSTLASIAHAGKLISLGGNQVYWKVRWQKNFTILEVHKDGDFFSGTDIPGGQWRNALTSEARILGVAFSPKGYGSSAPYKVVSPDHFLFKGTHLSAGDTFGIEGFDQRGICSEEMDQRYAGTPPQTILLAKGLNPGDGGGDLVFLRHEKGGFVLSCGSIGCGSGLGVDPVFSNLVSNFMALRSNGTQGLTGVE